MTFVLAKEFHFAIYPTYGCDKAKIAAWAGVKDLAHKILSGEISAMPQITYLILRNDYLLPVQPETAWPVQQKSDGISVL